MNCPFSVVLLRHVNDGSRFEYTQNTSVSLGSDCGVVQPRLHQGSHFNSIMPSLIYEKWSLDYIQTSQAATDYKRMLSEKFLSKHVPWTKYLAGSDFEPGRTGAYRLSPTRTEIRRRIYHERVR